MEGDSKKEPSGDNDDPLDLIFSEEDLEMNLEDSKQNSEAIAQQDQSSTSMKTTYENVGKTVNIWNLLQTDDVDDNLLNNIDLWDPITDNDNADILESTNIWNPETVVEGATATIQTEELILPDTALEINLTDTTAIDLSAQSSTPLKTNYENFGKTVNLWNFLQTDDVEENLLNCDNLWDPRTDDDVINLESSDIWNPSETIIDDATILTQLLQTEELILPDTALEMNLNDDNSTAIEQLDQPSTSIKTADDNFGKSISLCNLVQTDDVEDNGLDSIDLWKPIIDNDANLLKTINIWEPVETTTVIEPLQTVVTATTASANELLQTDNKLLQTEPNAMLSEQPPCKKKTKKSNKSVQTEFKTRPTIYRKCKSK